MQFRPLRKLKIQFEKSNNAGQFAGKCASHPNAVGIVHRLDTMRPIGGPGFLQHSRLFFARSTFPPSLTLPVLLVRGPARGQRPGKPPFLFPFPLSSFFSFSPFFFRLPRRVFELARAKTERNRPRCAICIAESKSGR